MTARQAWDHLQLRIFQLVCAVAAVGILWNLADPVYSTDQPRLPDTTQTTTGGTP